MLPAMYRVKMGQECVAVDLPCVMSGNGTSLLFVVSLCFPGATGFLFEALAPCTRRAEGNTLLVRASRCVSTRK